MGKLRIATDPSDPTRLRLSGDASGPEVGAVAEAAATVLAASRSGVVFDLDGLTAFGPAFVTLLNEIAGSAASGHQSVTLETPLEGADRLQQAPLHRSIRIERTEGPPARRAPSAPLRVSPLPSPGAPRREGRGFVTSYGEGRACKAPGCTTPLSRYNHNDRCAEHRTGRD